MDDPASADENEPAAAAAVAPPAPATYADDDDRVRVRRQLMILGLVLGLEAVMWFVVGRMAEVKIDERAVELADRPGAAAALFLLRQIARGVPAVMAAASGVGVIMVRRWGWLLGMVTQAVTLAGLLLLYRWAPNRDTFPPAGYALMALGIGLVLFLNLNHVRLEFFGRDGPERQL